MSGGVDLEQFYETFFEEAAELLDEMEEALLGLDTAQPDNDLLNGIFRVARSIKGGAATFGSFPYLATTTHRLDNILDALRRDALQLRKDMIDLYLATQDALSEPFRSYRPG